MAKPVRNAPSERMGGTIDQREVAQFDSLASEWWNPSGQMKPLHRINPVRLHFIRDCIAARFPIDIKAPKPLQGLRILDIGCGGGLLSEPLARLGATVTGIDPGSTNVEIAKVHASRSGVVIDYRSTTAEDLVGTGARFDVVLAMEVIEHVSSVQNFVDAASALVAPGGLFIGSTLNRTMKSFALAIVGAEYILRWLPKGTHAWEKFVRPDEFSKALERAGLVETDLMGMVYAPMSDAWQLSNDTSVNYFIAARRP
ncbi:MAG: bifunctional 2-polyprenyl-6-hydroxyphenol methylase/3-demethylubiquinol 3-O-methyltransferase UbiG [Beijerinckiaceae bacterium]|nr:bifunctional 2-polyprenyl-6-hydroxyphenol methylase/3-demethylubiquinol 3-O-methyltransferase UbiG [Beijerinckiaceae bacterium]